MRTGEKAFPPARPEATMVAFRESAREKTVNRGKTVITYREHTPPVRLADSVECFWTQESFGPLQTHRVMPDGCADLLFSQSASKEGELLVVGAMTDAQVFDVSNASFLGVRFRPGMSNGFVGVPGSLITNRRLPFDDVRGAKAKELLERLVETVSTSDRIALLESHLNAQPPLSPAQRALKWVEQRCGVVRIDEVADQAGLSPRQFRRQCMELTGLTPKQLCRTLRFRFAISRITSATRIEWARLALECGYYDQAHFINEFRALSGLTPGEYSASLAE